MMKSPMVQVLRQFQVRVAACGVAASLIGGCSGSDDGGPEPPVANPTATPMVAIPTATAGPVATAATARPTATSRPAATATPTGGASADERERQIGALLSGDPGQRRASVTRNDILAKVARERALDMGRRNYFSHTNPDGLGANTLVRQAGYVLPDFYDKSPAGNNIESIGAGYTSAAETWRGWLNSPGHREHVLGETEFYAAQIEYGVGYAFVPGSTYGHYWVIITARKPGADGNRVSRMQVASPGGGPGTRQTALGVVR